ncbi:MAG: 2Fe-2S iron-sulfur cluster-binding protein [Candidatus Competibacterales bacterium]
MKAVTFDHDRSAVAVHTQDRLLDALLSKQLNVKMLCKGRGLCATCHVYVTANPQGLTPPTPREELTLSLLSGAAPNSRLACQAHVIGEGVEVELPRGLYVESFAELETLIGQRTREPILHPINGMILIQQGKIITRSAIMQLKGLDFSPHGVDTDRA